MASCQVQTGVLPIVKSNAHNERVYQLSYADQRGSRPGYVNFTTNPSYIGILVILLCYITFLSEVKCM